MHGKLTQPKIDGYISWLRRNDHFGMTSCIYDDKSQKLLDELFELLEQVAPESPNGVRTLWLRAERGPIEDFGNAAEEIAEGNYDSEEEFVDAWKSWFPEDVKWYHFQAVEDKAEGYRAVAVRHSYVIVQDKRREPAGWPCEISEFVQWLVDGVRSCIEMLKAGTYNDVVRENLPPQHRTGTIRRRDFWNVWPDARVDFFKDISPADVTEFIERVSAQEENYAAMKIAHDDQIIVRSNAHSEGLDNRGKFISVEGTLQEWPQLVQRCFDDFIEQEGIENVHMPVIVQPRISKSTYC